MSLNETMAQTRIPANISNFEGLFELLSTHSVETFDNFLGDYITNLNKIIVNQNSPKCALKCE